MTFFDNLQFFNKKYKIYRIYCVNIGAEGDQMLIYKKFFQLAESKNLNIDQLRKMFTPRTIYRLENSSEISAYTINKICCLLKCQPGDFMEYSNEDLD